MWEDLFVVDGTFPTARIFHSFDLCFWLWMWLGVFEENTLLSWKMPTRKNKREDKREKNNIVLIPSRIGPLLHFLTHFGSKGCILASLLAIIRLLTAYCTAVSYVNSSLFISWELMLFLAVSPRSTDNVFIIIMSRYLWLLCNCCFLWDISASILISLWLVFNTKQHGWFSTNKTQIQLQENIVSFLWSMLHCMHWSSSPISYIF